MIEIYTRKAWLSLFNRYSCIVIDTDDCIYDAEDYRHSLIKYPIGYIKEGMNGVREIYGKDYRTNKICYPVGYLVKSVDGVIEVYDETYRTKHIKYPIGYIKDNQYFSYDEYHSVIRYPEFVVQSGSQPQSVNVEDNQKGHDAQNNTKPNSDAVPVAIVVAVLVIMLLYIVFAKEVISGGRYAFLIILSMIGCPSIGALIASLIKKRRNLSRFSVIVIVEIVSTVSMWITITLYDFYHDSSFPYGDLFFGWILCGLVMILPAVIVAHFLTKK